MPDLLQTLGYGQDQVRITCAPRNGLDVVVEASGDTPGRAWISIREGQGRMAFAVFEVHPNAWEHSRASLQAAADTLLLIPPG
jgi:hypothetical protein